MTGLADELVSSVLVYQHDIVGSIPSKDHGIVHYNLAAKPEKLI